MSGSYPDAIKLEPGNDVFENLKEHSKIINELAENEPKLMLSADILFRDPFTKEVDQKKWELFVDFFFPELDAAPKNMQLFNVKGNTISINPKRATKYDILDLLDFMGVDTPVTMIEFAREQARKQIGTQLQLGHPTRERARAFGQANNLAGMNALWNGNNNNNNNNNGNNNNNNNNNNKKENNVNIGYAGELEEYLTRASPYNKMKVAQVNWRYPMKGRRATRRRRSNRRATRRTTRR